MSRDIKNIYEAYKLLSEISKKDMDLVRYDRPVEELPFENIFGNKLRVVLPIGLGENSDSFFDSLIFNIEGTITHDKFKAKFPNILKFVRFDYKTKKAIVKIKTQMGEKNREETLASLVDKMFKAELLTKEYRDKAIKWIEQNVSQIIPSSYVVLSRSIIDNLRMSDISGIQSCHSPGGGYYSSCLSEAAGGGVIAFVIDGGELKKKQIENIETDQEIFSDKDRSVEGLDAVYRLRMRKYYSEEIGFFVLPESKVYQKSDSKGVGNSTRVPGLLEVVTDFLKSKQDLDKDTILQLFIDKDIVRKGGSYEDTADSFLFNQYFGGNDFKGYIGHEEEELDDVNSEEAQFERRFEQFQDELRDFLRRSGVLESEHVVSGFQVDNTDDGDVYYTAWGGIELDLEDIELIDYENDDDELIDIEKDTLARLLRKNTEYKWDRVTERKSLFCRELIYRLDKIRVDKEDILDIRFSRNGYTVNLNAFLSDYNFDDGTTSSDPDNYPPFLRTLMEWEDKHDQIKTIFIQALTIAGYAELTENQKIQYGLGDYQNSERTFSHKPYEFETKYTTKNLKYQGEWAYFTLQTGINPTYLYNYSFNNTQTERELKTHLYADIKTSLGEFIKEKIDIYYREHEQEIEQETIYTKELRLENYNLDISFYLTDPNNRYLHFDMKLEDATSKSRLDESPSGLAFKVSFTTENRTTLVIKTIDRSIVDIGNIIKACFIQNIKPEDKWDFYDRNLLKTYERYLRAKSNLNHKI